MTTSKKVLDKDKRHIKSKIWECSESLSGSHYYVWPQNGFIGTCKHCRKEQISDKYSIVDEKWLRRLARELEKVGKSGRGMNEIFT